MLEERRKAENHGELHPDPSPLSTLMVSDYFCSNSVSTAEEAGLIKPPTSP